MSRIKETIHKSPEYQAIAGQETAAEPQGPRQAATVGEALGPVTNLEKGDVEFWMQVVTIVLLFLILQELRRGGR